MMEKVIMKHKNEDNFMNSKNGRIIAGQSGFSLIEVMVAIFILSVGILAVCNMQVSGLKGNTTARQYTDYATLAMEEMEMLMATSYSDLPVDGANDSANGADGTAGLFTMDSTADSSFAGPDGNCTVYINVAPDDIMANTTTVSVTVVWSRITDRHVSLQGVIPRVI